MSRISVDVSSARIPVLQVGYQGENEVTDVLFDISSWITEFGEGVAQLRVKRPGNSEEESYVLSLTITDGKAVWTVSETDTANKGNGKVQLSYMVGNIVKKAVIYPYKVGKSIVGADNPVDPFDSWIERSKAWAIGKTLDGNDVPETDETYQNNAKYYAEQADILGSAQVVLAAEKVTLAAEQVTLATEKADAAAASEAAVNGVSTQLTTRMSAIETEQAVQDARMDTFTSLPEGSTSGNAELADIRVGANGTTYDTAGNAVRGQIGELKSDLDDLNMVVKTGNTSVINKQFESFAIGKRPDNTEQKYAHTEQFKVDDRLVYFDSETYTACLWTYNENGNYIVPVNNITDSPINVKELWNKVDVWFLNPSVQLIAKTGTVNLEHAKSTTYYTIIEDNQIYKNKNSIESLNEKVSAIENKRAEIIAPSKFYAVVGHEFIIFYDNLLKCYVPDDFVVTTECDATLLGHYPEFDNCFKFKPVTADIGTHELTIKVIDKHKWTVVTSKTVNLVIMADKQLETEKKLLFIGDSLTYRGLYAAELENMNNFKSVGTIERKITYNDVEYTLMLEGRNAWSSYNYVDNETFGQFSNAFYNPSTGHFDFAYYMENNAVEVPDVIFLNLGTNGGNGYAIHNVLNGLDAMIASIKAYSTSIPIAIHIYPTPSRAGNTDRYMAKRTVWSDKDSRVDYYNCIKQYIEKYDGADSQVHLIPVYHMLDPVYDYQRETVNVSDRSTEQITIGKTDGTHPANSGYLHMADAYYNWLIYHSSN